MFYVEMVDGEPLVPMNPKGAYPPGIERLFRSDGQGKD